MSNKGLHRAQKGVNNEFYTLPETIEKELPHYKEQLEGKTVYCNCDLPESEFVQFFNKNFSDYKLKGFLSSWYNHETGAGDFRSKASKMLLEQADVVITNPPFSLFREFLAQLVEYDKKFLIIGPLTALGYKNVFPLFKEGKAKVGYSGNIGKFKNGMHSPCLWYTNLHVKPKEFLTLTKEYNPVDYPTYDNYDAIEVGRVANIPKDYNGVMGVSVTFLNKYNPEQFDIIGFRKGDDGKDLSVGGKDKFTRVLIKRRQI